MTLAYYNVLRAAQRETGAVNHGVLTRCVRCRIFFLTDTRNKNRQDLRCPFGCRHFYTRESSDRRSAEYSRSDIGKVKKKHINAKRKRTSDREVLPAPATVESAKCQPILSYIAQMLQIITRLHYSTDDIWKIIEPLLRQHSLDIWGYSVYFSRPGSFHPP